MLFAKALSILFSLFAGLESAKGALYHYVCGKGKDRAFPYLAELKQQFIDSEARVIKDVFVWTTVKDSLNECLLSSSRAKDWENDLYFTVGGFTVNATIIDEGILYEVSDYYDWHGPSKWGIPKMIYDRLPKFIINICLKYGFQTVDHGHLFPSEMSNMIEIKEDVLSSFGKSYYHKGSFVLLWEEIDCYSLYCSINDKTNIEEISFILKDDYSSNSEVYYELDEWDSILTEDEEC